MSPLGKHRIVLVSGPPASGKTTLARPLAERLGFALLSKDDIKESLFTALDGPPGDVAFSRSIGAASMDLLWALAPHCPAVVLEANFRAQSQHERAQVAALAKPERRSSKSIAASPRRSLSPFRRARPPGTPPPRARLAEMSPDRMIEYEEPFALSPVIEVDTTRPIDIDALVAQIQSAWTL